MSLDHISGADVRALEGVLMRIHAELGNATRGGK